MQNIFIVPTMQHGCHAKPLYHLNVFCYKEPSDHAYKYCTHAYLPTLPVFPGVSKFITKSPGLSECLLGDFRGLFLDIVFNDILTM